MLLPAAVLIVVLLSGLAVDGTARYLTHRALADAATAAANDAVAGGLDAQRFTKHQQVVLTRSDVERIVSQSLSERDDEILRDATHTVEITSGSLGGQRPVEVFVRISGHVRGVFFSLLDEEITATGSAIVYVRG